jgi:four helix bundle protein
MQDFRKLHVWQKAHRLALDVSAVSASLAAKHRFQLRDQMLRAAYSMPTNLAEGCGRSGDREFRRFVRMALGSASELEYHLLLARDLGLVPDADYTRLSRSAGEVKRMLSGLAARLSSGLEADG